MKALILAAGLGTRLSPLTDTKPKALVDLDGQTLLERTIHKLLEYHIDEIIVNVHHYADQIEEFLDQHDFGVTIQISDERKKLLGNGGALKHAQKFLDGDEPFLVYNVDIFSDIDIYDMLKQYHIHRPSALLAVRKRNTQRYLCFDQDHVLCGWKNLKTHELRGKNGEKFAFSGIHLVDPRLFEYMPDGKFSIIDFYLSIRETEKIMAYDHSEGEWMDLGTPERLKEAESLMEMKSVH